MITLDEFINYLESKGIDTSQITFVELEEDE